MKKIFLLPVLLLANFYNVPCLAQVKTNQVNNGVYLIQSKLNSRYIGITKGLSNVTGSPAQLWDPGNTNVAYPFLIEKSQGKSPNYTIKLANNPKMALCMNIKREHTPLTIMPYTDSDPVFQWVILFDTKAQIYFFESMLTNTGCVFDYGDRNKNGENIVLTNSAHAGVGGEYFLLPSHAAVPAQGPTPTEKRYQVDISLESGNGNVGPFGEIAIIAHTDHNSFLDEYSKNVHKNFMVLSKINGTWHSCQ